MADIEKSDWLHVDFAALRTLRYVYELSSFSLAASRLGVKQSTVSYTIDRLRRVFDDPLFVQSGNRFRATPRCSEIFSETTRILARYEALTAPPEFHPENTEFSVVLGLNYLEKVTLLASVVRFMRRNAPNARIQIVYPREHIHRELEDGRYHLLVTSLPVESGNLHMRHLYSDRYVCVVDCDSRYVTDGITQAEYALAHHVLVSYGSTYRPGYVSTLESTGARYRPVIDLASSSELDEIISGTDLIGSLPERFARTLSDRVAIVEPPCEETYDVYMYWTEQIHHSPQMEWIRELLIKAAASPEELR